MLPPRRCGSFWPRLPEGSPRGLARQPCSHLSGPVALRCRRRTIEIDDIDANRRRQAGRIAPPIDLGDELIDIGFLLPGDLLQRLPHHRLKPDAGAMTRHDDVVDY